MNTRAAQTRAERFWRGLKQENPQAMLITSPGGIRYLTGFTGSEAHLLLTRKRHLLIVDSRYSVQAKIESRGVVVVETKNAIEEISRQLRKDRVKKLAFEPEHLTVARHREMKEKIALDFAPLPWATEKLRSVKDSTELAKMKKSAEIASRGFLAVLEEISEGMEERNLSLGLELLIRKNGAEAIPFPLIVVSGKRGALPHGVATRKRLRKGELITFDFGAVCEGYCSDETCTVVLGTPTGKQKRVYQAVKDAHDKAIDKVRPGIKARQIDAAARRSIERKGMGKYFRHGTGHGVGLAVHEAPRIAPDQEETIEEGMVFTVEPGIYIPGWGGVRIEDMVRVTRQGCEIMSSVPKSLYRI